MRIIAGKYKAKKIIGPKTENTRPTLDRVKEALFSIITPWILNANVLDLFSGTGNLGLEALSRGAKFAWLNDKDGESISIIAKNVKLTQAENCVKITRKDYTKCLAQIESLEMNFDVIFLDPPYDSFLGIHALEWISKEKGKILSPEGIIVYETDKSFMKKIESSKNPDILNSFEHLEKIDQRSYGNVILMLYKWR